MTESEEDLHILSTIGIIPYRSTLHKVKYPEGYKRDTTRHPVKNTIIPEVENGFHLICTRHGDIPGGYVETNWLKWDSWLLPIVEKDKYDYIKENGISLKNRKEMRQYEEAHLKFLLSDGSGMESYEGLRRYKQWKERQKRNNIS